MAGDVTVSVQFGQISTSGTGAANFTKAGFGTPKAWIIIIGRDLSDDGDPNPRSNISIGFGDGTNNFCIAHQDENFNAKVDCDAIKSNTKSYIGIDPIGVIEIDGTSTTITDGVRLTNTTNTPGNAQFATVIMFGGADLNISLQRTAIASGQDGTVKIPHSGFTDGDDKLIFFIGTDIGTEDNPTSGINNSFGVCHATGSDAGGHTFVQRSLGWASDHNNTVGTPHAEICTDRVLNIITEAGDVDWGLEVTNLDHSPAEWTITTRDKAAGNGMEVYSLALDLDDRSAKVGSVDSPTVTTFSISGMGFKPQYVGMMLTDTDTESVARAAIETADVQAGVHGISSNSGSGEEACESWYNAENVATTDTATLFRSRVIDLRDHDTSQIVQNHSHSSFDSGGVTHTVNIENETVAKKWGFWAIEEAAVPDVTDEEWAGTLGFGQQEPVREPNEIVSY